MADGSNGGGGIVEAVVKPVVDEVGKAIEVGVQSVMGTTPDPAAKQKKDEENAKKKDWALKVIAWNKKLDEDARRVRMEKQQQEHQKQQVQAQEDQAKKQEVVVKKQQQQAQVVREAQTRSEVRKGVGG